MGSKYLDADYVYVFPRAILAVMGADGVVSILHHKILSETPNEEVEELRNKLVDEYTQKYTNPTIATAEGYVDDVISINEIHQRVFEDIKAFENKNVFVFNKKHKNISL
jgi:acetyl-CoA carboxylase carboxyltransferase component